MKFTIKHKIKGRLRVSLNKKYFSFKEADTLQYYLSQVPGVTTVKVYERTADASITYTCSEEEVINAIAKYRFENVLVPQDVLDSSGREINSIYKEKLVNKILIRYFMKTFVPAPIGVVYICSRAIKYVKQGIKYLLKGKLKVEVLDATAITVSIARGTFGTAGSVMFLLEVGELLEEWTHKKSVGDLARSMSLNVSKVWLVNNNQEILVSSDTIKPNDEILVRMGNVIPFDGEVVKGEGMVNQASLTGEGVPVHKSVGTPVFAGTVVEEGELVVKVLATKGATKYEKIVAMIEESEKLKSESECKANNLADKLVPYTFLGTGLVYAFTRNITKTLAVLMVDFSCALKLAMPVTVLAAIREASKYNITVKGGKFLEEVAEADVIVFDKTGTLTKARPTVKEVVPFIDENEDELLRVAACLEEHFPHSMAKAVVKAAKDKHLEHEEMHSKVNYIVAHGISSEIEDRKVIIGSYHFVFEDENAIIPNGLEEKFKSLPLEYSHLYMAIDGVLAAVICIEDPLREEAPLVINNLRKVGFKNIVMMTGDSNKTANAIAKRVGVDQYFAEVLPDDKANFINEQREKGHKVIMIGDGINDSPALSAANVGIAISDGAEIAREVADITIGGDNLESIVTLKKISLALMKRINKNYRSIVGINGALIAAGVGGIIQPTTSALLHNISTVGITVKSMSDVLPKEQIEQK